MIEILYLSAILITSDSVVNDEEQEICTGTWAHLCDLNKLKYKIDVEKPVIEYIKI